MYVLQGLQRHSCGSHIFNSQILGRREPNDFVQKYTPLIGLAKKSG